MMEWMIVVVAVVLLFLALDTIKSLFTRRDTTVVMSQTTVQANERMGRLEAEVDAKVQELHRHQSERMNRLAAAKPSRPAVETEASEETLVAQQSKDPMNDTRCMAAVKEKAEEIERLGRQKGIQK